MVNQENRNRYGLRVGWWVAATVSEGIAPARCFVGQVEHVGEEGIRLTLMDWLVGRAAGWDVWIPWRNLECAMVCTGAHDLRQFGESAGQWQEHIHGLNKSQVEQEKQV